MLSFVERPDCSPSSVAYGGPWHSYVHFHAGLGPGLVAKRERINLDRVIVMVVVLLIPSTCPDSKILVPDPIVSSRSTRGHPGDRARWTER